MMKIVTECSKEGWLIPLSLGHQPDNVTEATTGVEMKLPSADAIITPKELPPYQLRIDGGHHHRIIGHASGWNLTEPEKEHVPPIDMEPLFQL